MGWVVAAEEMQRRYEDVGEESGTSRSAISGSVGSRRMERSGRLLRREVLPSKVTSAS